MDKKQFVITKKIAKHGKQVIIVVPKVLEDEVKPGSIVKLTIDILKEAEA
jgi:predicted membrane GTPase involved in stress response